MSINKLSNLQHIKYVPTTFLDKYDIYQDEKDESIYYKKEKYKLVGRKFEHASTVLIQKNKSGGILFVPLLDFLKNTETRKTMREKKLIKILKSI